MQKREIHNFYTYIFHFVSFYVFIFLNNSLFLYMCKSDFITVVIIINNYSFMYNIMLYYLSS